MSQKKVYFVSIRVFLFILGAIILAGGMGGAFSSYFVVRSLISTFPEKERFVERVETAVSREGLFEQAIEQGKQSTVGILDEEKNIIQQGAVLTADGIIITTSNAVLRRSSGVMLHDGTVRKVSFLREYPERNLTFLRASGSFSAPQFFGENSLKPGIEGLIMRIISSPEKFSVRKVFLESFASVDIASDKESALEKHGVADINKAGFQFKGSPLINGQKQLLGMVIDAERGLILPVSEINLLLQDYLRNLNGEIMEVHDGLKGHWVAASQGNGSGINFIIDSVDPQSVFFRDGIRKGDIIISMDGKPFPSAVLWTTFLEAKRAKKPVAISIVRGGREIKLDLEIWH